MISVITQLWYLYYNYNHYHETRVRTNSRGAYDNLGSKGIISDNLMGRTIAVKADDAIVVRAILMKLTGRDKRDTRDLVLSGCQRSRVLYSAVIVPNTLRPCFTKKL